MPVIAISNQKGGVGKTTTTLNLGAALTERGKRVLLVDLDPQGNLSVAAGLPDVDAAYPSIGDLLMVAARGRPVKGVAIEDAIVESPSGLDLVPSNGTLSAAELGLVSAMNREAALATTLKPVLGRYDYVLIDCLPSLGLLAINALRAAHGVVIPVQADFLAMQGLAQILETIAAVREQLNPSLHIYGVLLTMVDARTQHAREVVNTVRESLAGQVHVFKSDIRLAVVLKETAKAGRSVLNFDSNSPAAEAYRSLARELMVQTGDALPTTPAVLAPADPAEMPARVEVGRVPVAAGAARGTDLLDLPPDPLSPTPLPARAEGSANGAEAAGGSRAPASAAPGAAGSHAPAPAPNGTATMAPPSSPGRPLGFGEFLEGRETWLGTASR